MQPPAYQYPQQPGAAVVYPPQPGQTNVVISPAPVQTSYIVQNAGAPQEEGCCSGTATKFNATGGMVTGIIQLIIAILVVILGGASLAITNYFYYPSFGIWSGLLFFLPAGILGALSKNRGTCVITGYLVMSIFSTLEAFSMMCYEGAFAGFYVAINSCSYACSSYYSTTSCVSYCNSSGAYDGAIAIHAVLAVLAFIEFVVSIAGAAVCCGGLRCCCASPLTTATTTTTTSYAYGGNPNQGYVVQPAQPGQPGQPAPYENKM